VTATEIEALVTAEKTLRALATRPGSSDVNDEYLYGRLSNAHNRIREFEKTPPNESLQAAEAQRYAKAALDLCTAWFRFAAVGGLAEDGTGLRGTGAAELVCSMAAAILELDFAAALLPAFSEYGGLGLFGSALCHVGEEVLLIATTKLRHVAVRCTHYARRQPRGMESLTTNIEAFRNGLFARLRELASRPGRRLRVRHFKELVNEIAGVLSNTYSGVQVFEMGCLLSLQLTVDLSSFCEGVPEGDAVEAVDWMASVMSTLLSDSKVPEAGPGEERALGSPDQLREWIADNGLWSSLLLHAGSGAQRRAHTIFSVLLSSHALAPYHLVGALADAGAFPPSHVTPPSRIAMQSALLVALPTLGAEAAVEFFGELCGVLGFEHLTGEGINLLVRATQQALAAGHDPTSGGNNMELSRSLAFAYLLHYLQWGYHQPQVPTETLDCAQRALFHTLAPHPALAPLLPALAAEALTLAAAASASGAVATSSSSCVHALGAMAVDAARLATASPHGGSRESTEGASSKFAARALALKGVSCLCSSLPSSGAEPPLMEIDAQFWVAAFVDALGFFLRLPGARIEAGQVSSLWTRLIIQPVFGLPVLQGAMQYFKLAFLAEPAASQALLEPLATTQDLSLEAQTAHNVIFCPASFGDDPPPLSETLFFPDLSNANMHGGATTVTAIMPDETPPPSTPIRRLSSKSEANDPDMYVDFRTDDSTVNTRAAAVGIVLPETSSRSPRLRLDQVQAVLPVGSSLLLGELYGYDAIERRLWDEFEAHGRVDDGEALRHRDAAAMRCRGAIERDVSVVNAPAPLQEAHQKFSELCDLLTRGTFDASSRALRDREEARARAEDEVIAAKFAQARASAISRRRCECFPPVLPEVATACAAFTRANVELIMELRHVAARVQLGLVELVGIPGFARALRAAGKSHGDPLLERLQRNNYWLTAQSEDDTARSDLAVGVARIASAAITAPCASLPAVAAVRLEDDPLLARPEGLLGYVDVSNVSSGGRVLAAHRRGAAVALKVHSDQSSNEAACRREIRALHLLRQACVVSFQGLFRESGKTYLELEWCSGGTLFAWCEQHAGVVGAEDLEAFVKCLGIFRQFWHAVAYVHSKGAMHGDLCLENVLLTGDHRPVLSDFENCFLGDCDVKEYGIAGRPTPGYAAPELEDTGVASACGPVPTKASDVYAGGVSMSKAFLSVELDLNACPCHPTTGQRRLPDERTDVDVADLLQLALAQEPRSRPSAEAIATHRALDPTGFLRRRGLLGGGQGQPAASDGLLGVAEQLREEYRGRRVDEPLIFARDAVFDAFARSRVGEWAEEAVLGEWRVVLSGESGVDGGGLRREVITLFFEQLAQSPLVVRAGSDSYGAPAVLFIADRLRAELGPQQWRLMWSAVGAMVLRAVVHFGNAPASFSSAVFDCAFGRLCRLPPDIDGSGNAGDDSGTNAVSDLAQLRVVRGDDWARSELLDLLRRLRQADAQKEAGYRWMLAQRTAIALSEVVGATEGGSAASSYKMSTDALETMAAMLEPWSYQFLVQNGRVGSDGSSMHRGAVLEWALLWDVYLKYIGGGDRWLAYEAFADGLSARGRRRDMWANLTGEQIVQALEGSALTADVVVANLEFKPSYGYDQQIQSFCQVIRTFSAKELSMFLRFSTGIGNMPASCKFPNGQKLTIRFMPDQLDRLPSAHTCFWVVDLPPYIDEDDMGVKLRQAIAAPQPFALS